MFVWSLTTYTFAFAHYYIQKGIENERRIQLNKLESIVRAYQERISDLTVDELDRMTKFIDLRDVISGAKESPLRFSVWRDYVTSLIFPTCSFVFGFVNISPFFQSLIP